MPPGNPSKCASTDNCAANTAAYMLSLASQSAASCNTSAQPYGMRAVRLLTSRELKNSLIDLGIAQSGEVTDDLLTQDATYTKSKFPIHTRNHCDRR